MKDWHEMMNDHARELAEERGWLEETLVRASMRLTMFRPDAPRFPVFMVLCSTFGPPPPPDGWVLACAPVRFVPMAALSTHPNDEWLAVAYRSVRWFNVKEVVVALRQQWWMRRSKR